MASVQKDLDPDGEPPCAVELDTILVLHSHYLGATLKNPLYIKSGTFWGILASFLDPPKLAVWGCESATEVAAILYQFLCDCLPVRVKHVGFD
jgi:hypothetical protein